MSDQTVPVVLVPDVPVEEKKKFPRPSRKAVGGFVAGIAATVVAVVTAVKLSENSDSSEPANPDTTDETFVDTDPTT